MTNRKIGIDILRIVAMMGIVGLHIVNQGGIISSLSINKAPYYVVMLVTTFFYTSVDVFAIITGYLYYNKKIKYKRIVELIFIALFYSILIAFIFYAFNLFNMKSLGLKFLKECIFPMSGTYWYIVAYILLFVMIPFLNHILSLPKEKVKKLLIVLFILTSVIPSITAVDFFKLDYGYSPFWLMYLYLIGGYIKKYENDFKGKRNKYCKLLFLSLFLGFALNIFINIFFVKKFGYFLFGALIGSIFIDYISPFTVISSILILLIFKEIKCNNTILNKIILCFSKTAFAVYIIHASIPIFNLVLKDAFVFVKNYNFLFITVTIIIGIIIIYVICSLIDIIREKLFNILKINKLIEFIGIKLDKLIA